MELKKILDLNIGSLISIVGAGGKSTLMYILAQELRNDNKILVTTTTKIYLPKKEQFDFIEIGIENFNKLRYGSCNGIYVYGSLVNEEGKLVGVSSQELEGKLYNFDYILVEADGSKVKPIKGWQNNEPVICKDTTKTIGVISIESIGKRVNQDNVHRVKQFINITNAKENEIITKEHITSLIFHQQGLFKNSVGEKILFINKIETDDQLQLVKELLNCINQTNKKFLLVDKIIIGSLKNKVYNFYSDF